MIDYKEQAKDYRWIKKSKEIMKRDDYTCQLCGKTRVKLNVHHIKYLKGIDYWDYPDELLMTVCEVCHSKIHGKFVKYVQTNYDIPNPKVIPVFNKLFEDKRFSKSNDIIVYSYLIAKSYYHIPDAYINGAFDFGKIREHIRKHEGKCKFAFPKIPIRKISKELGITNHTVCYSLQLLKECGLLSSDDTNYQILYVDGIMDKGFFKLQKESGLNGKLLIFYSYIKNKSEQFGGQIDTYKWKLAEELKTTKVAITNLLNRLYKLRLAKRLNNGNLILY